MSDESAFVKAFRCEAEAAAHERLVETYVWANSMTYGRDPALVEKGEKWVADIEASGKTWEALQALSGGL